MKLHGPAHPDTFRVKVGRYGDRHYYDPLPACDIAPACEDVWPSVTTIKRAAGKDWSWTSLERAADYLARRAKELDGLNAAEIHTRLLEVNKAGLNRAGNRGSSIHQLIEARAAGKTLLADEMVAEAKAYIPAVDAFLDDCQPEWLLSEVVIMNRAVGYGGTGDAGIVIDGQRYFVDWKTRRSADKHNAYDEECWQVAAYMRGEYMIVDRDGQATRERVPEFDGGLIVSLAPEGYRLYPIYVDQAWETFQELAAFARGKGRTFRGKPMSVPKRGHAKSEHIQRSLNEYLRQTAPAYTAPDEGPAVSDDDYTALERITRASGEGHAAAFTDAGVLHWADPDALRALVDA
jgi:hypothetical protein